MIETKSKLMKKGSWFITTTNKLPECDPYFEGERAWEIVLNIEMKMSWGPSTVNVHRKIKDKN